MKFDDEPKPKVPAKAPKRRTRRYRVGRSSVRFMAVWVLVTMLTFVSDLLNLPEWWRFLARLVD